ncbi:hypothetical protein PC116_g18729 [Phytophthora cactorum]|nr:hypothetical protein PC116_g18729 [Phytophthora cactorum]
MSRERLARGCEKPLTLVMTLQMAVAWFLSVSG